MTPDETTDLLAWWHTVCPEVPRGWYLEADPDRGYDPDTDLHCEAHIDAACETIDRAVGGSCWSGDDAPQFCATCGCVVDTGGLTAYGVSEELDVLERAVATGDPGDLAILALLVTTIEGAVRPEWPPEVLAALALLRARGTACP